MRAGRLTCESSFSQSETLTLLHIFTRSQVESIFALTQNPWRTFFVLLTLTGMWAGEALGLQWEDIDTWIDTWETPGIRRHEIRELYYHAPAEIRAVHPIRVHPNGRIEDCWRWCIFSAFKE